MASATTTLSHPGDYDLRTGPQLRRPLVCGLVCAGLFTVLALATLVHLDLLARMRADVALVFYRALVLSTLLSFVPLGRAVAARAAGAQNAMAVRRGISLARMHCHRARLAVQHRHHHVVDQWVAQNPEIIRLLGPEADAAGGADFRADRRGAREGARRDRDLLTAARRP
jgi:hypothetical protein